MSFFENQGLGWAGVQRGARHAGLGALCALGLTRPAAAASVYLSNSAPNKCSFAEAVTSINLGATQGTCQVYGTYGSSDYILLGTATYNIDAPTSIKKSVIIQGNSTSESFLKTTNPSMFYAISVGAADTTVELQDVTLAGISGNTTTGIVIDGTHWINTLGRNNLRLYSAHVTGFNRSGIYNENAKAYLSYSLIDYNTNPVGDGGGINMISLYGRLAQVQGDHNTISFNTAQRGGGIFNSQGKLTMANAAFTSNHGNDGGAVYTISDANDAVIDWSALSGNSADSSGGAIWSGGLRGLTLNYSTISANTAAQSGGALFSAGRVQIATSTLSGNRATAGGGGAIKHVLADNNYLEIYYSTIAYNRSGLVGGGVDTVGSLAGVPGSGRGTKTSHCIVARNTYGATNIASDYNGTPQSAGPRNTLFGSTTGIVDFDSAANLVGDPKLTSLATNSYTGSPVLKTHRMWSNSPAVNAWVYDTSNLPEHNVDERGFPRACTSSGVCDLGAFERQSFDP